MPFSSNADRRLLKLLILPPIMLMLALCWTMGMAHGQIYRWQDENGHWHFSDSPTSNDENSQPLHPPAQASPAPQQVPVAMSPATSTRGGLLWKISKNGRQPSYLLGTIHSADPRVTRLKPAVSNTLDQSDRFVMEMQLDTHAIMQFGATMMIAQGEDLESILGTRLFARAVDAMAGLGMPEMVVRQLKPWVVMAILSMPPPTGGMILDMVLYQRAMGQGKPTSGLETAQEQLAVFEGLSRQDQIELLELTLDQLPSQPALIEKLIQAYAADDLDSIARISRQNNSRIPSQAVKRFMLRLNDERNVRMVGRILPYLDQANSFIAVGALHLPGDKGILALLRAHGYVTTPVQ